MKTKLILLASFALGTGAIAQDTAPVAPPAPATMPATPDATAPMPAAASTDATPAPTSDNTSATVDTTAAAPAAPAAVDTSNYPPCSASVTDKCVQHGRSRHPR